MSPADPLEIAIRAEESAKAAHHRLDRMNGSIDKLTMAVAEGNAKSNAKMDTLITQLAREDGRDQGKEENQRGWLDNTKFLVTTIVLILGSSLGALLFTWLARGHS